MKIQISRNAVCGDLEVPAGEYWVALAGTGSVMLTGGGRQFKLKAVKRRTKAKTKTTTVSWYCGGGTQWSLVVSTPKHGEWISMLELPRKEKMSP